MCRENHSPHRAAMFDDSPPLFSVQGLAIPPQKEAQSVVDPSLLSLASLLTSPLSPYRLSHKEGRSSVIFAQKPCGNRCKLPHSVVIRLFCRAWRHAPFTGVRLGGSSHGTLEERHALDLAESSAYVTHTLAVLDELASTSRTGVVPIVPLATVVNEEGEAEEVMQCDVADEADWVDEATEAQGSDDTSPRCESPQESLQESGVRRLSAGMMGDE